MDYDTIAAMATPMGTSGIGIIRISGSRAVSIVEPVFRAAIRNPSQKGERLRDLPSQRLRLGHIVDPLNQSIVDEAMVVIMRAPNSYTREDVVEIQSHSGHVIMSILLNMVLDQGARLAEPGEFTKRAFLNGRLDLSQAEAVADVISARSQSALQLASTHLSGHMRAIVEELIDKISDIQVTLEARIEFPDETEESVDFCPTKTVLLDEIRAPIQELMDQYREGHFLRDGIRLGIVGRPNVGKSSLLNGLLRKDKAIVTPIPGTTRDLIEDQTCIEGVPVLITDTAGLRPSTDPVEIVGIERAHQSIETSDIILFVVDGSRPFNDDDLAVYERVKTYRYILCVNKMDLIDKIEVSSFTEFSGPSSPVIVSAKTGEGLSDLKMAIKDRCLNDVKIEPGRSIVPNQRQKIALERAQSYVGQVLNAMDDGTTEELIVSDLGMAKEALGQIVGQHIGGDILDEVFNRFCIGK